MDSCRRWHIRYIRAVFFIYVIYMYYIVVLICTNAPHKSALANVMAPYLHTHTPKINPRTIQTIAFSCNFLMSTYIFHWTTVCFASSSNTLFLSPFRNSLKSNVYLYTSPFCSLSGCYFAKYVLLLLLFYFSPYILQ